CSDDLQPIPLGHEDVHEHEIGTVLAMQPEPRLSVGRLQHVVPGGLEDYPERAPKQRIIVYHEDPRHSKRGVRCEPAAQGDMQNQTSRVQYFLVTAGSATNERLSARRMGLAKVRDRVNDYRTTGL